MARKRTFGELKKGSYVYTAGRGCVSRVSVVYINYTPGGSLDTGKVKVALGHHIDLAAYIDKDATEFISNIHHWFTSKDDARRCAYQLLLEQIDELELQLDCLKARANDYLERYIKY